MLLHLFSVECGYSLLHSMLSGKFPFRNRSFKKVVKEKVKLRLLIENFAFFNSNIDTCSTLLRRVTKKRIITKRALNFYGERTTNYLLPRLINNLPLSLRNKINERNIKYTFKNYFKELYNEIPK